MNYQYALVRMMEEKDLSIYDVAANTDWSIRYAEAVAVNTGWHPCFDSVLRLCYGLRLNVFTFLSSQRWCCGQSPITNHQSPITNHQSQSNHQSPITNHQSPITNHQSPITNHQSPITNHQSPITNHNHQSPITNHQSPSPITNHRPQSFIRSVEVQRSSSSLWNRFMSLWRFAPSASSVG